MCNGLQENIKIRTYINDKKKNICDIATTPPIKNPTAIELWNLRIIIVPPMLRASNIRADQTDVKPSDHVRIPTTAHDIKARIPVIPRIEYLHINEGSKILNKANT